MRTTVPKSGGIMLTLAMLLLISPGCSTFNTRWETAGRFPDTGDLFDGRWEGTWRSNRNNHSGRLRCIVRKQADNTYHASFQAKYWGFLLFHYPVLLRTSGSDTDLNFSGQANLGWWAGGLYSYTGRADREDLLATYTNRHDHGIFEMRKQ